MGGGAALRQGPVEQESRAAGPVVSGRGRQGARGGVCLEGGRSSWAHAGSRAWSGGCKIWVDTVTCA